MYLNILGSILSIGLARLIETIVVFEFNIFIKRGNKQWRLIETIVVFEYQKGGVGKTTTAQINRNNSCIWMLLSSF